MRELIPTENFLAHAFVHEQTQKKLASWGITDKEIQAWKEQIPAANIPIARPQDEFGLMTAYLTNAKLAEKERTTKQQEFAELSRRYARQIHEVDGVCANVSDLAASIARLYKYDSTVSQEEVGKLVKTAKNYVLVELQDEMDLFGSSSVDKTYFIGLTARVCESLRAKKNELCAKREEHLLPIQEVIQHADSNARRYQRLFEEQAKLFPPNHHPQTLQQKGKIWINLPEGITAEEKYERLAKGKFVYISLPEWSTT